MSEHQSQRSGIVVLVGRSNVGKSTLLNSLIGTKVAITTPKPQTTRNAIQGVIHDPRGQAVIVDTPGIFTQVPDRLTAKLNETARESLAGIDVIVYVVDPTRFIGDEEQMVHRMVMTSSAPKIMVINKSDRRGEFRDEYLAWSNDVDVVIEISALHGKNVSSLLDEIFARLPEGEPLYPPDQISNISQEFRLSELVREKIFLAMGEEVPYSTTVEVETVERRDNGILYIKANVLTYAERYKRMLIGAGARRIKQIGKSVRKELEIVSGERIFLDLDVQVDERWQERFE